MQALAYLCRLWHTFAGFSILLAHFSAFSIKHKSCCCHETGLKPVLFYLDRYRFDRCSNEKELDFSNFVKCRRILYHCISNALPYIQHHLLANVIAGSLTNVTMMLSKLLNSKCTYYRDRHSKNFWNRYYG